MNGRQVIRRCQLARAHRVNCNSPTQLDALRPSRFLQDVIQQANGRSWGPSRVLELVSSQPQVAQSARRIPELWNAVLVGLLLPILGIFDRVPIIRRQITLQGQRTDISEAHKNVRRRPSRAGLAGNGGYDNRIRTEGASVARGLNLNKYKPQPVHSADAPRSRLAATMLDPMRGALGLAAAGTTSRGPRHPDFLARHARGRIQPLFEPKPVRDKRKM